MLTDPLSLVVAGAALVVALLAGWLSVPAPPDLDGERWFKVILATLFRGEVERQGGDAAEWEARVVRFVPYHPAGRLPERKVAEPGVFAVPGTALPGEHALVEALARIDDIPARWERMYRLDEVAREARLVDPLDLGEAYHPLNLLGPGGSWDDLADWGAGDTQVFTQALRRRLRASWVLVEDPTGAQPLLLPSLAGLLGAAAHTLTLPEGTREDAQAAIRSVLEAAVPDAGDRLVLVVQGEAVPPVLQVLVEAPGLRDRMLAFVSVGGVVAGRPGDDGPLGRRAREDWMGRWFSPEALDTELNRTTIYAHVAWFDPTCEPPGMPGLPIEATRFPEVGAGRLSQLQVVDLGLLPADPDLPLEQAARGLWAVVTLLVLAAR